MSLASLIAGVVASGAGAVANAVNNKNKGSSSSGSSSSSSSGSSSGSSGSSGSSSVSGFQGSAADYDRLQNQANQLAQQWHDADTQEERDHLHDLATIANQQLGKTFDEHTGVWSGGYSRPADYTQQIQQAGQQYQDYMQQASDQQQAAIQAGVDSAVADLNAQRDKLGDTTAKSNAAAEKAYMQTINPNGSLAENLAANGLLPTGVTETSQIQAGNTYQNALNQNAITETELLAEIDRQITQAQLSGDIEKAQALADYLTQIAQTGYQMTQDQIAANQWQQQFQHSQAVDSAGLTGYYNGAPTLEAQRLEADLAAAEDQRKVVQQQLELGKIDQETARKQLEMLDAQIREIEQNIVLLEQQERYNDMQM